MVKLNSLQKSFFLLVLGFSLSFACVACGDDEEEEPFDDPNQEQTDNGGGGSQNEETAPTDSIMPPAEEPSLPTDSIAGGEDEPMIPADSILVIGGHEAVDLGLSVKWATCNVGASSPEEYGNYFAWGETTTKSSYTSKNCPLYGRNLSYIHLKDRGIINSNGNLTSSYDAATANWGSKWRMPTFEEIKELLGNCTWKWTTYNGVNGHLVTGPNGNSVFLPSAGHWDGTNIEHTGSGGHYWSAAPLGNGGMNYGDTGSAYYLHFGSNYYTYGSHCWRYYGHTVRPVTDELSSNSEK